jgi:mgtE-like transporter
MPYMAFQLPTSSHDTAKGASAMRSVFSNTTLSVGSALVIVAVPAMVWLVFSAGRAGLKTILRESLPVLTFGIVIDLFAGATVERQFDSFVVFPALLVLLPAFLALAGAIGGTLSSRLGSQLHLGMVLPAPFPEAAARSEIGRALALALPMFAFCGVLAHFFSGWFSLASPGLGWVVLVTLSAGVIAAGLAALVAYYSTIGSVRAGLDPDTYGIPMVTSTLDLFGAFTLILAIEVLGVV